MKYESTILKRLIDTYGVVGNPRYISEIIKEFIVRGKECFPNLFTYQADWLAHIDEFGLNPTYTVSYTGQSIYAPNTLERPVKSAILSGSTKYRDIDTGEFLETFEEGRNLELVSVKMPVLTTTGKNLIKDISYEQGSINGTIGQLAYSTSRARTVEFIKLRKNVTYTFSVFSEQENVQFREFIFYSNANLDTFKNGGVGTYKKTFTYTPQDDEFCRIIFINNTSPEGVVDINSIQLQLEQGSTATSYEPYKSNILTVNEDVELRGIGEIQDTLDCLTGEKVERIGEIVLDGGDNFRYQYNLGTSQPNSVHVRILLNNIKGTAYRTLMCDKLPLIAPRQSWGADSYDGIGISSGTGDNQGVDVRLWRKDLSTEDLNGVKEYLSNNPITVQYELTTESVKTVDLTILDQNGQNVKQLMSFNGGTHFNTASSEGSPLPTVSVSVETDLEETLMMCSLEGNTL